MSYTTFEYSNLSLASQIGIGEGIDVQITVKNTGDIAAKEVVQLYLEDMYATVTRPLKSLKAYSKIHLEPQEQKTITLHLNSEALSLYNEELEFVEESRTIKVHIENLSQEFKLQ